MNDETIGKKMARDGKSEQENAPKSGRVFVDADGDGDDYNDLMMMTCFLAEMRTTNKLVNTYKPTQETCNCL